MGELNCLTRAVTMRSSSNLVTLALALAGSARATEYNSFDGPGFPTCYDVTAVHNATSVDESEFTMTSTWVGSGRALKGASRKRLTRTFTVVSLVQAAAASGKQVRAGGKGHMCKWCPEITVIAPWGSPWSARLHEDTLR